MIPSQVPYRFSVIWEADETLDADADAKHET